jgi:hypothetical protein
VTVTRRTHVERGFALPMTIFLVTLLSLMLAAAFTRITADRDVDMGNGYIVDAFEVAQSGLQMYMGTEDTMPNDGDSVRINVPGGYAWIVARLAKNPADTLANRMFLLRSTGYVLVSQLGSTPQAQRSVAQFAQWQPGRIKVLAPFVAANGIDVDTGGDVEIDGHDKWWCSPQYATIAGMYTSSLTGSPSAWDMNSTALVNTGTPPGPLASDTKIDWNSTISGQLVPDYTSYVNDLWTNAVQIITGDLTLPSDADGNGLLVVSGNLKMSNTFYWQGVVLVGGRVTLAASWTGIEGTLVSGLNAQISGGPIGKTHVGGTDLNVHYDSCIIQSALSSLIGFVPVGNAWIDDWASY